MITKPSRTQAPVAALVLACLGLLLSSWPADAATVKVRKSRYGHTLTDGKGLTLYIFTYDRGKKSRCYGDCATAWPPLYTDGQPKAQAGAKQKLLGTTKRRDGRTQVTYRGRPLYYYVSEDEPGEILCQAVKEFGGYWYVIRRNGKIVTRP